MTMDAMTVLERLRHLGVAVSVRGDRLRLEPGSRVTADLIAALRELKPKVLAELDVQRQWESQPWMLQEWRRVSLPQWRGVSFKKVLSKEIKSVKSMPAGCFEKC